MDLGFEIPVCQNLTSIDVLTIQHWAMSGSQFSSVQFSRSVVSNSLRPHEAQHTRPPCPSPTPGVHSDPRPSSRWCHPAISSSVVPFFSCPQSFPASESFPTSQLFTWGGQSIGVSASASVLPKNTQDWSPLGTSIFSIQLWKCCTQFDSKFGKLSSGRRTGKGQFSFQSQRKAMPKNAQTTTQLHSSHTLVN